ncbi:MAG: DUF3592 domain-containing protein [Candidatus Dojkabacteria bacterium]|nr:DUF3592 domain-containing protein [Candidatus Dojkabacteria bacterium]
MNILLIFIGIALLVFGFILLLKNIKLLKSGIKMEADIVDVLKKKQENTDSDGYTTTTDMYFPVFKYTYEGQEYTKESSLGVSNKRKYQVGGKLNIVFMPDTPEKVKVKNGFNMWVLPVVLLGLGVMFIISYFVA